MIGKLRRRIILINMLLIGVLLAGILVAFNINRYADTVATMERGMNQVFEKESPGFNGHRPAFDPDTPRPDAATDDSAFHPDDDGLRRRFGDETPIQISTYVVVTVENGSIVSKTENGLSVDEQTLQDGIDLALNSDSDFGQIERYGMMYVKRGNSQRGELVLASNSSIYTSVTKSVLISAALFAGGMAVVFLISLLLSGLAVKPVQAAWNRQKQFVADASHELKTPLTVILANNNIMLSHPAATIAQERQWLESTDAEAGHMKKLIDNMLFLAKSDAGTAALQLSEVNFSELAEACALHFEPVAFERNILIDADITPGLTLQGDATQLTQLTHILTDNAVKYAEPDSTVTMRLYRQNDKTVFSVNNRGNVIAKENLAHLFDRFYRADKSRSTEGYGLGLSIAQRIVENMKGSISVESNETNGTTFRVRL